MPLMNWVVSIRSLDPGSGNEDGLHGPYTQGRANEIVAAIDQRLDGWSATCYPLQALTIPEIMASYRDSMVQS